MTIDLIQVKRLKELIDDHFHWEGVSLTYDTIIENIDNVKEIDDSFPDSPLHPNRNNGTYTKEWHIGRIKYFVNNPNKITPISIDNYCFGNLITGMPIIVDGSHRFIAAVIRGDSTIPSFYSGLILTLDYLTGKTDKLEL